MADDDQDDAVASSASQTTENIVTGEPSRPKREQDAHTVPRMSACDDEQFDDDDGDTVAFEDDDGGGGRTHFDDDGGDGDDDGRCGDDIHGTDPRGGVVSNVAEVPTPPASPCSPSGHEALPDDVVLRRLPKGSKGDADQSRHPAIANDTAIVFKEEVTLPAATFPTFTLTPCREIPSDADEGGEHATIADRYAALTKPLPLVGDIAMRPGADGGVHLIEELRERAPWYGDALTLIERQLEIAIWSGRPWLQWRPLVLTGPPGTGKSYLARLIAQTAGANSVTVNLGGSDDVRMLAGTARGWRYTQPAWPAVVMSQAQVANPILVLEEVDKVDPLRGQQVFDVLLTMIERSTARRYYDPCLLADVDLSACLWLMTANDLSKLPAPLRSRVDVAYVAGPAPEHFELVLQSCIEDVAGELGVAAWHLPALPAHAVKVLRDAFARRRSIRLLRRWVEDAVATLLPALPLPH